MFRKGEHFFFVHRDPTFLVFEIKISAKSLVILLNINEEIFIVKGKTYATILLFATFRTLFYHFSISTFPKFVYNNSLIIAFI